MVTNLGTTDNSDYTLNTESDLLGRRVRYHYNQTSKTLTIAAPDDSVNEDPEIFLLSFGTLPVGVIAGPQSTATVTITDQ